MKLRLFAPAFAFYCLPLLGMVKPHESTPLRQCSNQSSYRSLTIQEPIEKQPEELTGIVIDRPDANKQLYTWHSHPLPAEIWMAVMDFLPRDKKAWDYLALYFGITQHDATRIARRLAGIIIQQSDSYQHMLDTCDIIQRFKTAKSSAAHEKLKATLKEQFFKVLRPWQEAVRNGSVPLFHGLFVGLIHKKIRKQMALPLQREVAHIHLFDDSNYIKITEGPCCCPCIPSIKTKPLQSFAFSDDLRNYLGALAERNMPQTMINFIVLKKIALLLQMLQSQNHKKIALNGLRSVITYILLAPALLIYGIANALFFSITNTYLHETIKYTYWSLVAIVILNIIYDYSTDFLDSDRAIKAELDIIVPAFLTLFHAYERRIKEKIRLLTQQTANQLSSGS